MDVEQKTVDLSTNAEPEMENVATIASSGVDDKVIQYDSDENMNCPLEDRVSISENPENVPDTKKFKYEEMPVVANNEEDSTVHKYVCDLCQMDFKKKSELIRHIICHMKIKPYRCNICEAKFSNSYTLKRHNLIHSNIKPYTCKVCQKSFRDSSNFRKHRLQHSNIRFNCVKCGIFFRRKSYLKAHLKIHDKAKSWTCSTCSLTFYTKKDKIRHETTHSGQKDYCCTLCDSNFGRKDNLDRHIRNSHMKHQEFPENEDISMLNLKHETPSPQELDKIVENTCTFQSVSKSSTETCLLHPKKDSENQFSDAPEGSGTSSRKEENENAWQKILEANNKRESVIFKSNSNSEKDASKSKISKNHLVNVNLTEHVEINFSNNVTNLNFATKKSPGVQNNAISSDNPGKSPTPTSYKQVTEMSQTSTDAISQNDQVDSSVNSASLKKEVNTDLSKNEDVIRTAYYGHKRKYINFKNKLNKPIDTKSNGFHEFNNAKATLCIYQLASKISSLNSSAVPKNHYPPESIELYKKILMPKYRSKEPPTDAINLKTDPTEAVSDESAKKPEVAPEEVPQEEVPERVDGQNHSENDVQASPAGDIHWRRRLAQISNCEKQTLEK